MIVPIALEKYYSKRTINGLVFYTHGIDENNSLIFIAENFYDFNYKALSSNDEYWHLSNLRIFKQDDWLYIYFVGRQYYDDFHLAFYQGDADQMKNYFNKLLELSCYS